MAEEEAVPGPQSSSKGTDHRKGRARQTLVRSAAQVRRVPGTGGRGCEVERQVSAWAPESWRQDRQTDRLAGFDSLVLYWGREFESLHFSKPWFR